MDVLDVIRESWAFTGLEPRVVHGINAFGNVLVEGADGRYWRICPEDLSCDPVAESEEEFQRVRASPEFQADWRMERLVSLATSKFGSLPEGSCFCLKIPAVLGGAYDLKNVGTITIGELLATAGDIAFQIKDLPNGSKIRFRTVD
jgi:hypothetical protein